MKATITVNSNMMKRAIEKHVNTISHYKSKASDLALLMATSMASVHIYAIENNLSLVLDAFQQARNNQLLERSQQFLSGLHDEKPRDSALKLVTDFMLNQPRHCMVFKQLSSDRYNSFALFNDGNQVYSDRLTSYIAALNEFESFYSFWLRFVRSNEGSTLSVDNEVYANVIDGGQHADFRFSERFSDLEKYLKKFVDDNSGIENKTSLPA